MEEFRFVGNHADELDGGCPLEPGQYTGPIDPEAPKAKQLIEDGMLISVPNGTLKKADAANTAATSNPDDTKEKTT